MKSIDEQIEEARDDLAFARATIVEATEGIIGLSRDGSMAAYGRLVDRAEKRLATLEAVRDGLMIPVYATVCADRNRAWEAYGWFAAEPLDESVLKVAAYAAGDVQTILRGYAHVPSTQVHEVEADSEVPS